MLLLIQKASGSAVSLEEMVEHLRREDTEEDDDFIEACTTAATDWAEKFTGLALIEQTFDEFFDAFPTTGPLYLSRGPLLEVVGVFGRDSTEAEFTGFSVDYAGGSIYLPFTGSWPNLDGAPNAVRIRYRAGYVDTTGSPIEAGDVPEGIKAAIKIYAATLYGQREDNPPSAISVKIPWGAEALLRMYRIENSLA